MVQHRVLHRLPVQLRTRRGDRHAVRVSFRV